MVKGQWVSVEYLLPSTARKKDYVLFMSWKQYRISIVCSVAIVSGGVRNVPLNKFSFSVSCTVYLLFYFLVLLNFFVSLMKTMYLL